MILILEKDGKLYVGNRFNGHHQEHLLSEIERLLEETNSKLDEIDTVSPVIGPGSFTGIRLAVSTVKALTFVHKNMAIAPIDKLDFLDFVLSKEHSTPYILAIPCTKVKSYVLKNMNNSIDKLTIENDALSQILKDNNMPLFVQNGEEIALDNANMTKIDITDNDYLDYVSHLVDAGKIVSSASLEPVYMAVSQAEEELLKKESK